MPLPDAPDYSKRIYELLKETDLENLTYSQFQGVAEKLFIEPENEDEMRRLVLVQLARMAVRGDWDGFLTGGGGSGGAPTDAEYVVMSLNGTLTNERVLTAGTGIGFVDAGAGESLTVYNSGVTQLTAGSNITVSSATGGITIAANDSPVTSLIAGTNISLSPSTGLGDVTITASGSGGGIGGSITDNQVAVGATAANDIEGSASFTYDVSTKSLNIAAGAGTGTVLSGSSDMVIRNSGGTGHSKITLGYDAANSDIKLDTDGTGLVEIHKEGSLAYSLPNVVTGANDYVLTAQTDGSTAWAASGGGSAFNPELVGVTLDATGTGYSAFDILSLPPYGCSRYNTGSIDVKQYFYPFIAPKSGDIDEIIVNFTSGASGATNVYYGFYRDNSGVPSTLLGYATANGQTTGSQSITSFSGTVTLVKGTQYWLAQNKSTTDSITQRAIDNTYRMRIAPYEEFPSTSNGYGTSLTTNSSVSAAPSDTTAEDLEPGIYFSGLGACPHVSIKVS